MHRLCSAKKDSGKVGHLYSIPTDGSGRAERVVQNLPGISDVAVDPNTGNVYYGLRGESCTSVFGCTTQLSSCSAGEAIGHWCLRALPASLPPTARHWQFASARDCNSLALRSSVLHYRRCVRAPFYTRLQFFCSPCPGAERAFKIESVDLDGTRREDFVAKKLPAPNRLYAHEPSDMLYWSDLDLAAIERANVLTGRRCVLSFSLFSLTFSSAAK